MSYLRNLPPAVLLAALLLAGSAHAQDEANAPRQPAMPSPDAIADIRSDLQARQRAREAAADEHDLVGLEPTGAPPEIAAPTDARNSDRPRPEQFAWLALENDMDTLRALVICTSEESAEGLPERRAPLVCKGVTWLALKPGRYRIQIIAAPPNAAIRPLRLAPMNVELTRNRSWRLRFDHAVESALRKELKAVAKEEEAAEKRQTGTK